MLNQFVLAGYGGTDPRKLSAKEIGDSVNLRYLAETDPEAAAILHMENIAETWTKAPTSAPLAYFSNPKTSWVVMGKEGWSLAKTAAWVHIYAKTLGADRWDLMCTAYAHAPVVALDQNPIPLLITACETREHETFVHARRVVGDQRRGRIERLERDPAVDIGLVRWTLQALLPHKHPLPDRSEMIHEVMLEVAAERRRAA